MGESPRTRLAAGLYSHPRLLLRPRHTPHWPRSSPATYHTLSHPAARSFLMRCGAAMWVKQQQQQQTRDPRRNLVG